VGVSGLPYPQSRIRVTGALAIEDRIMIVVIERRPTCIISIAFASLRRCVTFFLRGIIALIYASPALIAMLLSPRFASWRRTEGSAASRGAC
jgi:hypothetical protein